MLVVTELDDPFLPMPDDLLVNLHDSRELVDALLDALPAGYNASTSNDAAMGPALQVRSRNVGFVVLRVSDDLHFHATLTASTSNNAAVGPALQMFLLGLILLFRNVWGWGPKAVRVLLCFATAPATVQHRGGDSRCDSWSRHGSVAGLKC